MSDTLPSDNLTPWDALSTARQIELREQFGYYLDSLPPTCSLDTKIERFRQWLAERGVSYVG